MIFIRIFMQAFTMTFVAEWGDRSQIATIVLAARENLWGVISGGVLGHSICTGLAVIGGRLIASKISVKTITIIGGLVFIAFAITSSIWDPTAEAQDLQSGKTLYIQNRLEKFGIY
jgi:putative Ca2+/H+ antiporter (TMEM165/GDT1 family)